MLELAGARPACVFDVKRRVQRPAVMTSKRRGPAQGLGQLAATRETDESAVPGRFREHVTTMPNAGLAGIEGSHKLNPPLAGFAVFRLGPKTIRRAAGAAARLAPCTWGAARQLLLAYSPNSPKSTDTHASSPTTHAS